MHRIILLFYLLSISSVTSAKINENNTNFLEKKHYSICLNGMHTYLDKNGIWILMQGESGKWLPSECLSTSYKAEMFDPLALVKDISVNVRIKEINPNTIWIFIPN